MNITKEQTGELTAQIKVELIESDYREKVDKTLKDLQRKANIPGFRPGHIPMGLVKKMYGKSALADEVNKLLSDSLYNYLRENKINILGEALPNGEKTKDIDWETQKEFEFFFDLGIAPEFELNLANYKASYFDIQTSDEQVEEYLMSMRKRYGKVSNPETVESEDMIYGHVEELDENKELKEGGISAQASLILTSVKDKDVLDLFVGAKKDDEVVFNIAKAFDSSLEISKLLKIKEEVAKELTSDFRFAIEGISRMEAAELNEEFYTKVFPGVEITSEAEAREKLRAMNEESLKPQGDRFFFNEAVTTLIKETSLNLPDEFLKRWLTYTNTEGKTQEIIESEYEKVRDSIKWQLIEQNILLSNNLTVSMDEVRDYIRNFVVTQYFGFMQNEESNNHIEMIVDSILKNQEEVKRIYETLLDQKVIEQLKAQMNLDRKTVSFDEFVQIAKEKHEQEHNHE